MNNILGIIIPLFIILGLVVVITVIAFVPFWICYLKATIRAVSQQTPMSYDHNA